MNYRKDFEKYALSKGLSSLDLHYFEKNIIDNSMTPYILEERQMNVTQMDVFSRLLRDRTIWAAGPVDDNMSNIIQAQLIYLDSVDKKDITIHINSPGGSVLAGLGIVDVMNYISSDVATINTGMCASMGSILLSAGAKGKRSSLVFSKVMIHQVSHGTAGNIQDTRINQFEAEKYNFILFKILSQNCDKTFDEMIELSKRDRWYNSDEALQLGIIDEVIKSDKSQSVTELLKGFDEYYIKQILSKDPV